MSNINQLASTKPGKNTDYGIYDVLGGYFFREEDFSYLIFQKHNPLDLKGFTAISKGVWAIKGLLGNKNSEASEWLCESARCLFSF